jgi:hypothetical protein
MSDTRSLRFDPAEQRQRCKRCGSVDGFNFDVPDELWERVVPEPLRTRVVCLACFDELADAAGIEYADALRGVCFAGRRVGLVFVAQPPRRISTSPIDPATRHSSQ